MPVFLTVCRSGAGYGRFLGIEVDRSGTFNLQLHGTHSRCPQNRQQAKSPLPGGVSTSAIVKGFGCRSVRAGLDVAEGRRSKASRGGSRGPVL